MKLHFSNLPPPGWTSSTSFLNSTIKSSHLHTINAHKEQNVSPTFTW